MRTKIIFLLSLLPALFFGQTDLVIWNSNNNLNATVMVSNITSAPMSASGVQLSGAWQQHNTSTGVPYWTTSGAIDLSQYVQFTVTANAGYQIEPDAFKFRYNASGPQKYQVRYSKTSDFTGGGTILIEETNFAGGDNDVTGNFPNDFKVLPGETLYIRFYAYANSLTWYSPVFFKHGANNTNGPKITGTVSEFANVLTANNDNVVAEPNQTTALDVLANDMEGNAPINSVTLNSSPSFGTVVWNNLTQKFDYTPNNDYFGPDSFTYTIGNGVDDYSTATVNIFVSGTTPTGSLSGIYLIDDQYGHFNTITNAVAYLNTHAVTGEVTFLLCDEIYDNNTGEIFPIEINASPSYTVTFKPAPNKTVNINAYNINNWSSVRALFKLNGAKNIIFNGSDNEYDSKYLTLTNHCSIFNDSHRTIFWLTNQTENIVLKNMTLMQGSYNADSAISAAIFAGNDTSIKFDNYSNNPVSKLKVYKNLFKGVKQGVCIFNSENNYSTDIEVYHNDLGTEAGVDKITHSIYLRGVQGFNIYNNIIYDLDITFTGGSDYSGIYVGGNSINGKIYKNQILGIDRQTNHLITGIKLSSTNSSENVEISITNNMIANVRSLGGGSLEQGGYGIYLEQGKGYKIFHNTVSMKHNQATGITAALFVNSTAANLDIRNNIFSITQTDQGNTSFKTAIIAQSPSFATAFNHLDYNNYVIDSSQVRSFVGGHGDLTNLSLENSDYKKTLDDWKATSGQDLSSGSQETNFVSDMNLHISDSNAWVNNTGVSLAEEFAALGLPYDDIDDQPRSITNPDIGADEFGIPSFDPGICETTLYWNGTSWGDENGNPIYVDGEEVTSPTRDFLTEIRGAYDTEIHGSFSTCELTIATGGSLRIAGDDYVFIVNRLINNLSAEAVIVENNGSIVQETDFNENVGAITYKRKAMPMFNYDYTYWGSPVTGQTTAALSPNSGGYSYRWNPEVYYNSTYGVYMQRRWGNENSDYVKYSGVMEPGHGYIIKAPNNFPSNTNVNPSIFTAKFIGVPNSGTYIVETTGDPGNLLNGSDGNDPDTGYPQGDYAWNFFGNPYPSAIDIEKFRLANNQILGDNVYLWSHNTKPVPGETYYQYVANDFAVYNAKLGQATCATPYPEGSTTPDPNYNHPTRFIAAGQGFFMPAKTGAVQFNNSMRVSTINGVPNSVMPNNHFYKVKDNNLEQEEIHNIKLSIRNEQGAFHQILLGYVADASNGIDDVDGILFGGNYVSLYSVVENYHLVVQGRSLPFNEADEVPLGFSLYMPGEFSIHLDYFDGLFEENNQNQDIYLYDSYLDVLHNLKNSPYEFTSEEGSFNDRFVLKYMNTLSVDNPSLDNNWAVYSKDGQLHVKTNGFDIKDIVIYDMLGRIVYQQDSINNNLYTISTINNNQILIVKITSTDNITSTKKHLNRNK